MAWRQPELRTERLHLRTPVAEDADHILEIRSDEVFSRHTGIPVYTSIEQAAAYIEKISVDISRKEVLYWSITAKGDGSYAGGICLWNIDWENKVAELGYDLIPVARGRGIIAEALSEVLKYVFISMGFEQVITGDIHEENIKSMAVVKRAGFARTGEGNRFCMTRNTYLQH